MTMRSDNVEGRRARHPLELIEDLIPKLDQLIDSIWLDRQNLTENLAALRGSENATLWSGMVQLTGSLFAWEQDFMVPFAGVLVADTLGAGPLVVSTGGTGEELGAGTLQLPVSGYANAPITGRHLSITGASNKAIFVAVFTKIQTPAFGLL